MTNGSAKSGRLWAWLFAALLIFAPLSVAYAMRVSPMVVEISDRGSGAVARVEVENLNTGNLPFETRITRLDYDNEGNLVETPADADFLVFPPQGNLPPKARQVVRLQWVGPTLDAARGYYLTVKQLPVQLDPLAPADTGAQVQIVYNMKALIAVAPPGAEPNVEVVSAVPTTVQLPKEADGSEGAQVPGVEVRVRNTGTRHAFMAGPNWIIQGTGLDGKPQTVEVSNDVLTRDIGVGYLAALKGDRTFKVPTDKAFANAPIRVRFSK